MARRLLRVGGGIGGIGGFGGVRGLGCRFGGIGGIGGFGHGIERRGVGVGIQQTLRAGSFGRGLGGQAAYIRVPRGERGRLMLM